MSRRKGTYIVRLTRDVFTSGLMLRPGDRVEIGGPSANANYLIAHRVQQLGESWRALGPFAVVPKDAVQNPRIWRREHPGEP